MFPLRAPALLREAIKRLAERNHRSFNAEIVVALEQYVTTHTEPLRHYQ